MILETEPPNASRQGWFVPNDIDGFFGLFVDNIIQLIVVVGLCPRLAGLPDSFVVSHILPGIAVSLIAGNLFYAWQALRLSRLTGKPVTALPFGINTVSLFAFIFLILGPVYHETHDAEFAWKVALAAGLLGGVIEITASFLDRGFAAIRPAPRYSRPSPVRPSPSFRWDSFFKFSPRRSWRFFPRCSC